MIGIILALWVAFLKSLWELAGKSYTDEKKQDPLDEYSLVFWARIFSLVLLIPLVFYVSFQVPDVSTFTILAISAGLNSITNITAIKAVKHSDLSIVWPLWALTIPFLLVTSFFITGEVPNIYGTLWVLIMFVGTYFLWLHHIKQGGILEPLRAVYNDTWARYMLITAFLWGITSPLDKLGIQSLWVINRLLYVNLSVSILIALYMIWVKKSFPVKKLFQKKYAKKMFSISLIGGVGGLIQMMALKYTLVIYVIALKRASGMFSVILGWIFFKEKNIAQKFLAAAIIFLWVLFMILGWNI